MKTIHLKKKHDYDGSQLRSHWIFEETGLLGDAMVSFVGKCNVKPAHMIDLVDRQEGAKIYSEEMLHFIVELFKRDVEHAVLIQHLIVANIEETLTAMTPGLKLARRGNDLYDGKAKINISIATASPVSVLIHVGINVSNKNTPVLTRGLKNYNITASDFAAAIHDRFKQEMEIIETAICKVKPAN